VCCGLCLLLTSGLVNCCVLQETSCGQFAGDCVSTTARIMADAEGTLDHGGNYSFIRNFTPKPLPTIEVRKQQVPCYNVPAHAPPHLSCLYTLLCFSMPYVNTTQYSLLLFVC
jgi:hypothetical protein